MLSFHLIMNINWQINIKWKHADWPGNKVLFSAGVFISQTLKPFIAHGFNYWRYSWINLFKIQTYSIHRLALPYLDSYILSLVSQAPLIYITATMTLITLLFQSSCYHIFQNGFHHFPGVKVTGVSFSFFPVFLNSFPQFPNSSPVPFQNVGRWLHVRAL